MGIPEQLSAMLFELRGAGTPVAKARALARAWRTVRRLSPTDRQILAREAGFEGAEELVESLSARSGGVAPAMLLRFLDTLRDEESGGISAVVSNLRDPKKRDEVLLRGLDAAAGALDGQESEPAQALVEDEPPPPPPAEDEAPPEVPEAPPEVLTPTEPVADSAETEEEAEWVFEPPPPPPVAAEDDDAEETAQVIPREAPVEAPPSAPPLSRRPEASPAEVAGRMTAAGSRASRLRVLRRDLALVGPLDLAGARRLVRALPDGWARRRAVTALYEAGRPERIRDALDLLPDLENHADRRWCLKALMATRKLGDDEIARALEMLPDLADTERRRLTRRSENL